LFPFFSFLFLFFLSLSHNLVAFFDRSDPHGYHFASNYAGHNITIGKSCNGNYYEFVAVIADTCANDDCSGCCSANSNHRSGYLIDIEYYTAMRVFGTTDCIDGDVSFAIGNATLTSYTNSAFSSSSFSFLPWITTFLIVSSYLLFSV
jgi:hypothetical protein